MSRELDSREIYGCGGTVTLNADDSFQSFTVTLADTLGNVVHEIVCENRGEALAAFKHPFSFSTTPDVFRRNGDDDA